MKELYNLIYVDVNNNNNKFWKAFQNTNGTYTVQWGRVGSKNSETTHPPYYDIYKKAKEKLDKGYKPFKKEEKPTIDANVETVLKTQLHIETDKELPSKKNISEGLHLLNSLITDYHSNGAIQNIAEHYMERIPLKIGNTKKVVEQFNKKS